MDRLRTCCAVLAGCMTASLAAAEPAAMFRGGPEHSGVYASVATPTLSSLKWKFKTGARVLSSPVIASGIIYVGSSDHNLYALNAADGSLRWKFATQGAVNSSPAVAGGLVYVNSLDGSFYAVDAETGKVRWKFKTGGERRFTAPGIHGAMPRTEMMADPFDVFLSSPAIAGGMVYFGSGDHHVYALDAATGELRWKFQTGDVVHASPAIASGVVYIGSWDRYLYALDARTGAVNWKFETGDDPQVHNQIGIASSAAVANGTVFFGCRDGHFYAVDAATGKMRWRENNKLGWTIGSPAVRNDIVYFATSEGQRLKALRAADGTPVFNIENSTLSFSSPALSGGVVFYGTHDGWLRAVDAKTGERKPSFQSDGSKQNSAKYLTPEGAMNPAALSTDFTLDGMIIGLDRVFSLGSILSSPVISEGVLYVGSTDGNLYALR